MPEAVRIFVTGATGNVGLEVYKLLVSRRFVRARIGVRDPSKPRDSDTFPPAMTEVVAFDFQQPDTFGRALDGIERVFLMRPPHLANAKQDFLPFLTMCKEKGVGQIVFLSLLGADKNKFMPHAKIEKLILELGIPYTFLRAGFFMQNLSTMHAPEILELNDVFVPAGHGLTGFIDVIDIAEVAVKALIEEGYENKAYPLTGGTAITYGQVAEVLSEVLGRKITYSNPWVISFARHMRKRGFALGHVTVMCIIYSICKFGQAGTLTDDVKILLGREPTTFKDFAIRNRSAWEKAKPAVQPGSEPLEPVQTTQTAPQVLSLQ